MYYVLKISTFVNFRQLQIKIINDDPYTKLFLKNFQEIFSICLFQYNYIMIFDYRLK